MCILPRGTDVLRRHRCPPAALTESVNESGDANWARKLADSLDSECRPSYCRTWQKHTKH